MQCKMYIYSIRWFYYITNKLYFQGKVLGENLSVAGAAATAPLVGEPLAEDSFFAMIAGAPKPMPAAGQTGAKR
ncbi:hypothetical protein FAEPRAA2165_00365 [Faecalibacterium duncaniae]|uniref:Uncharacterized protein n=1 Tax=Faecalibacterium duncaniae (strain DSM 17677 / JCM 31915 / A2-165) TaxID=411483 RepID=C7H271_FAED2|nr:hypothetical protein FAEPRAA2165_00365 [Faecalibacterium duncaniae]